jgi:hypothetical protein
MRRMRKLITHQLRQLIARGEGAMRGKVPVIVGVVLLLAWFASSASAEQFTLMVDVGSTASVGMGSGGMLSTGGGSITFNGQPMGTFMHTSQSVSMAGMMGSMETFQQRMITFQLPGIGTVFAMMTGGSPWTGATGIIMGGTDVAHGISGTVTVGAPVGTNQYPFVLTLDP